MKEILEMNAPSYVYKGARGSTVIPLDSELLSERVILIDDTITSQTAVDFYKSVRFLAKSDEPIKVVICSGGGEVIAGQAIYDLMQGVKNEVHTYCIGRAASMAAVLLAAGTKGHRYILPHSEVMIHEVLIGGGVGGSATSISKISSIRSRAISVMLMIQAEAQLRQGYDDDAQTIISNCDTYVYLGGNDVQTAQAVSERCDKQLSEVLYMPVGSCWVFRRGSKPKYSQQTDISDIHREIGK